MEAQAFIQWKGTVVCCDFECSCGHYQHIDAEGMYYVKCSECGRFWESPSFVLLREVEPDAAVMSHLA